MKCNLGVIFEHPISGSPQKEFSKTREDVVKAMAKVNKKQNLPNKDCYLETDSSLWHIYN